MADTDTILLTRECGNCRAFSPDPQNLQMGQCRKRGPTAFVIPNQKGHLSIDGGWPPVVRTMWCDEYVLNLKKAI